MIGQCSALEPIKLAVRNTIDSLVFETSSYTQKYHDNSTARVTKITEKSIQAKVCFLAQLIFLQNMDAEGLHMAVDYVGSSGVILSTEQKAALQSSLVILKSNYKFRGVKLWGKILGVKSDYFIVQGVGKDELKDRKTLYR